MSNTEHEHNLTAAEIEDLDRCEAIAEHGLEAYVQVDNALAEIRDRHLYRDSHPSFDSYVSTRWGVNVPNGELRSKNAIPVLAKACEETLSALAGDERMVVDIQLAVRKPGDPAGPAGGPRHEQSGVADRVQDELLSTIRWLLIQASGKVAEVAHLLESRAGDIHDRARTQLRDDVLDLDDELSMVKTLLVRVMDWDSGLEQLLNDEVPPLASDPEPEDDER